MIDFFVVEASFLTPSISTNETSLDFVTKK